MANTKIPTTSPHLLYAGAMLIPALFGNAYAQEQAKQLFDIQAQPLSNALLSFGKQSSREILYSSEITQGLNTKGLRGSFTPEEALARLFVEYVIALQRH